MSAAAAPTPAPTHLDWQTADGHTVHALWRSEAGVPCPKRWRVVDDTTSADVAYKLACEGTALIWQGDFQNARHLLQALARRIDRQAERQADRKKAQGQAQPKAQPQADGEAAAPLSPQQRAAQAFHQHRHAQGQRASVLGRLLIPLEAGFDIALRRAPDLRQACTEVYGDATEPSLASLRELLGLVGAHEWRKKGVAIAALNGATIHAHHGVFSPVRGEYVDLVAQAPLPAALASDSCAFDIGVGSGVLSAVLARRGVQRVVATDQDDRALACAQDNLRRLGLLAPQGSTSQGTVHLSKANLFPEGRAPLVVCNPPWVPAKPSSPIEHAVYDPDSRMLRGFLQGLAAHLAPQGEGWLILSDLAEHLGLRSREQLLGWIEAAGLQVIDRLDVRPHHPKAQDANDPLHQARRKEVTSLWRLGARA